MEIPITISIIMATFNRAHLIDESINAIQKQSFQDWECLIIDDGSTDNSEEIIADKTAADPRFTYIKRPEGYRKGLPGCRNYGLNIARGEYIIFYDDDDIVHPENLSYCINHIKGSKYHFIRYDKQPFFGSPRSITMDPVKNSHLTTFSNSEIEKMITGEIPFASCCVLWNKVCFENIKFNESLMYAEEWECYSRILIDDYIGLSTNTVLYFNRKHLNSNTGEFWNNDPIRRASKIKAVKLVIENLTEKGLLSLNLVQYFIRSGFLLKDNSIIDHALKCSEAGFFTKLKYNLGYIFYPLIRPVFKLKGEFKKMFMRLK